MKSAIPSKILMLGLLFVSPGLLSAATIFGNLGGLKNPTGAATNGNKDRQYAWTIAGTGEALGAQVTVTYTLSTSNGDLSNSFDSDNIFRIPSSSGDLNVGSGQSITITINTIELNTGWTLNSVSKTDTVAVVLNGGNTARFSVNGGTPFDYTGTGTSVSNQTVTNIQFQDFNGPVDSLFFQNVDQTTNGGMNLRSLSMSFVVVPEPSSALLGGLGFLFLLRRRRIG